MLKLMTLAWLTVAFGIQIGKQCDEKLSKNDIEYVRISSSIDDNKGDWNEVKTDKTLSCLPDWLMILPGTKWCGKENIANNQHDLGLFAETDKCCKAHDFCSDTILAHKTKYNLTNSCFYTRLNCKCDNKFKYCLQKVNSLVSIKVGFLYFNILGTKCFRKAHPAKCFQYLLVPVRKCVKYMYNKSKPKKYQWFDVPQFHF